MSIPANIIIAWSGAINEIPNGWAFCDGNNQTPDLRNRFIIGAGNLYALNSTGGSKDSVLGIHSHTPNVSTSTSHTHSLAVGSFTSGVTTASTGPEGNAFNPRTISNTTNAGNSNHTHTINFETVGEDPTDKNLPPYYALAFIMKEAE